MLIFWRFLATFLNIGRNFVPLFGHTAANCHSEGEKNINRPDRKTKLSHDQPVSNPIGRRSGHVTAGAKRDWSAICQAAVPTCLRPILASHTGQKKISGGRPLLLASRRER